MTLKNIPDHESLLVTSINDSITTTYTTWSSSFIDSQFGFLGGMYVRSTRFETISSGTSGTLTISPSQTIILDDFGGTVDAIVLKMSGGRPTNEHAFTSGGTLVTTTLDGSGNWSFSGTPSSYPVAIVYRVRQQASTYDDTESNIMGQAENESVTSVNGKIGNVVLNALDVGALDAVNALTVELQWNQLYPSFYTELTYDINDKVIQQDMWDGPLKTVHLFQKIFTYSGNNLTQAQITNIVDSSVLTKNYNYDIDGFLINVDRTYTP